MSAADLTELLAEAQQEAAPEPGINKENKITIIAWGGDLDRIWPTLILSTTAAAVRHAGERLLHVLGTVRAREARRPHHRRQLDAEDAVDDEPGLARAREAVEALVRRRRRRR